MIVLPESVFVMSGSSCLSLPVASRFEACATDQGHHEILGRMLICMRRPCGHNGLTVPRHMLEIANRIAFLDLLKERNEASPSTNALAVANLTIAFLDSPPHR